MAELQGGLTTKSWSWAHWSKNSYNCQIKVNESASMLSKSCSWDFPWNSLSLISFAYCCHFEIEIENQCYLRLKCPVCSKHFHLCLHYNGIKKLANLTSNHDPMKISWFRILQHVPCSPFPGILHNMKKPFLAQKLVLAINNFIWLKLVTLPWLNHMAGWFSCDPEPIKARILLFAYLK